MTISKEEREELAKAAADYHLPWGVNDAHALAIGVPKLLEALEAAEARIAELEGEVAVAKAFFAAQRELPNNEDSAPLKARIAELEAAAAYRSCEICADGNNCDGYTCPDCPRRVGSQWQPMATALRNGTEILLSKGWNVFGQHLGFEVTNDWDDEYAAPDWRWLPIPALPEGAK